MYVYEHIERHAYLHLETGKKPPKLKPKARLILLETPTRMGKAKQGKEERRKHPTLSRAPDFFLFICHMVWYVVCGMVWYGMLINIHREHRGMRGSGSGSGSARIEDGRRRIGDVRVDSVVRRGSVAPPSCHIPATATFTYSPARRGP